MTLTPYHFHSLEQQRHHTDQEECCNDQQICEWQLVMGHPNVRLGVGRGGQVGLILPRVVVAVEQHRVLKYIPLGGGGGCVFVLDGWVNTSKGHQ